LPLEKIYLLTGQQMLQKILYLPLFSRTLYFWSPVMHLILLVKDFPSSYLISFSTSRIYHVEGMVSAVVER